MQTQLSVIIKLGHYLFESVIVATAELAMASTIGYTVLLVSFHLSLLQAESQEITYGCY